MLGSTTASHNRQGSLGMPPSGDISGYLDASGILNDVDFSMLPGGDTFDSQPSFAWGNNDI